MINTVRIPLISLTLVSGIVKKRLIHSAVSGLYNDSRLFVLRN